MIPPRPRRRPGRARLTLARPGPVSAVVLDRVSDIAQADTAYCIHGRAQCAGCGAWCWLGNHTHDLVKHGGHVPLCTSCARQYGLAADGNAGDHRRTDGPH